MNMNDVAIFRLNKTFHYNSKAYGKKKKLTE